MTDDPVRRLRQHNREISGGARATAGRNWKHVCVLSGFPTRRSALQFEWMWKYMSKRKCITGKMETISQIWKRDYSSSTSIHFSQFSTPFFLSFSRDCTDYLKKIESLKSLHLSNCPLNFNISDYNSFQLIPFPLISKMSSTVSNVVVVDKALPVVDAAAVPAVPTVPAAVEDKKKAPRKPKTGEAAAEKAAPAVPAVPAVPAATAAPAAEKTVSAKKDKSEKTEKTDTSEGESAKKGTRKPKTGTAAVVADAAAPAPAAVTDTATPAEAAADEAPATASAAPKTKQPRSKKADVAAAPDAVAATAATEAAATAATEAAATDAETTDAEAAAPKAKKPRKPRAKKAVLAALPILDAATLDTLDMAGRVALLKDHIIALTKQVADLKSTHESTSGSSDDESTGKKLRKKREAKAKATCPAGADGVIRFHTTLKNDYNALGNSYKADITIDDVVYPSVEHYYHCAKFIDTAPEYATKIRNTPNAALVKNMGRTKKVESRADWEAVQLDIMRKALRAKFAQHKDIATLLRGTGTSQLEVESPTDAYWGIGADGKGTNHLGALLAEIRTTL